MRRLLSLLLVLPITACMAEADETAGVAADELHHSHPHDAGSATDTSPSDAGGFSGDGTPQRLPCSTNFGSSLNGGSHGRLDGYLVSIVPSHVHQCHGDSGHVHLQISMNGALYDVAANVDQVAVGDVDAPLPQPWTEGWHANASLDYVQDLGMHSSQFQSLDQTPAQQHVLDELANANHISVFATKYSNSGIHLVHRTRSSGQGLDGAIVINPTSAKPHYVLFRFPDQTF